MENSCAKKCVGKWLLASLPVFIFTFAADFLIHGIWLEPLYKQTAAMWRSEAEMQQYFPLCILFHVMQAVLITALFNKCRGGCENVCIVKNGLCFGVIMGLFLAALHSSAYIYMPIPGEMAVKWFISGIVNGIGSGLILAVIFKKYNL